MEPKQRLREVLSLKLRLMRIRRKKVLLSSMLTSRRFYQRNILRKRSSLGEFATLVAELNYEEKDFFEYFRMDKNAFNEILEHIRTTIWHPPNPFQQQKG